MTRDVRVALVSTGGSIAFEGAGPLDLYDYAHGNRLLTAEELVASLPGLNGIDVVPAAFRELRSSMVTPSDWLALRALVDDLCGSDPELAGIVVSHGTATLEETAYFLNLASKAPVPVVLVGAQRPPTGLSSDAQINLLNALRVAAAPHARGRGVLVVLNDEIHAPRDVTKTATYRLDAFQSRALGPLGFVDPDAAIAFHRRPGRLHAPDTEFDVSGLASLPRVDIAYAYAGADGAAVEGFVRHGAQAIVVAGLAPGLAPPGLTSALKAAQAAGVIGVMSTRAGQGRVLPTQAVKQAGFVVADDLTPQKARVLAMLGLTVTTAPADLQAMFDRY